MTNFYRELCRKSHQAVYENWSLSMTRKRARVDTASENYSIEDADKPNNDLTCILPVNRFVTAASWLESMYYLVCSLQSNLRRSTVLFVIALLLHCHWRSVFVKIFNSLIFHSNVKKHQWIFHLQKTSKKRTWKAAQHCKYPMVDLRLIIND